jgi:hypothetical protein
LEGLFGDPVNQPPDRLPLPGSYQDALATLGLSEPAAREQRVQEPTVSPQRVEPNPTDSSPREEDLQMSPGLPSVPPAHSPSVAPQIAPKVPPPLVHAAGAPSALVSGGSPSSEPPLPVDSGPGRGLQPNPLFSEGANATLVSSSQSSALVTLPAPAPNQGLVRPGPEARVTISVEKPIAPNKVPSDASSRDRGNGSQHTSMLPSTAIQSKSLANEVATEFDLYPEETGPAPPGQPLVAGQPGATPGKRQRSPSDLLAQAQAKPRAVEVNEPPPSPPLVDLTELEEKWAAWTKDGLASVCKSHGLALLVTQKLAVIKVLVSERIPYKDPPREFQALVIRPAASGLVPHRRA